MERPEVETQRLMGSVVHFTPSVNSYSTTLPDDYKEHADILKGWLSDRAKGFLRKLEVDSIILEDWQIYEADTIFFNRRRSVSAEMINCL